MARPKYLSGQKFGRLTVLDQYYSHNGRRKWKCSCECGAVVFVCTAKLVNGHTQSCGCLRVERAIAANTKHGNNRRTAPRTKEYRTWSAMWSRCTNSNHPFFYAYGEMGVTVCEEWKEFSTFLNDVGKCPSPSHSIDRIDPNGNYTKTNCRWATVSQQANNKRNTRRITINGTTKSASEWSRELGISRKSVLAKYRASL